MSICIICREHPAEVPDRNSQSLRPVKRVCRACHAVRLRSDFNKRFRELGGFSPVISKSIGWEKP